MDRKTVVTRVLVIAGTILALFPLVATMVTSIIGSIMNRKFLMDYLMPAELGLFYLTGGIFLHSGKHCTACLVNTGCGE